MTGYIHITGAEVPEEISPKDEPATFGFSIETKAVLDSRFEAVVLVYNLTRALAFEELDYAALQLLSENPEGLQQYEFRLGGIMGLDEEDPHD